MAEADAQIRFSWTLRPEDAGRIRDALNAAHPQQLEERDVPFAPGGDPELVDLLTSVGLQLDQQVEQTAQTHTRLDGVTTVSALSRSLEAVLRDAPSGFIVDARFDPVHIDEHPSVGRGTIVLVDREGAQLLGSRQEAAVARALGEAQAAREA